MSSVGSPPVNANPLPYNHVPCPTCIDRDIVESEVAGCGNRIFCECCDFACPECQCRWDEMEELVEQYMEADLVQLRLDEDVITPARPRKKPYIQVSGQDILWLTWERHLYGTSRLLPEGGLFASQE